MDGIAILLVNIFMKFMLEFENIHFYINKFLLMQKKIEIFTLTRAW